MEGVEVNIGEAAARSGVPARTIRYYESIGLIAPSARNAAGYRLYAPREVETLRFVQRARSLGFPIEQVSALLALWRDRGRASADVKAMAGAQVAAIERKIAELQGLRDSLEDLMARCHGDQRPDCPILADLAGEGEGQRGEDETGGRPEARPRQVPPRAPEPQAGQLARVQTREPTTTTTRPAISSS
ncbi:MAG: Cu(I)-responsive transcriptional regulator [Tistlia sp.]|uniref:Cu(I)-responsive transcriptional regulator n=1 Tax=Tistlia sp. TaxID=3057121 RepID=UPI0034A2FBB8